jgi:uncharacterized membrane protein YgcG
MDTWVAPTIDDFKARFPGLAAAFSDATIQIVLDEAISECGEAWLDGPSPTPDDRFKAALYLTAHLLVTQQIGLLPPTGSGGSGGGAGGPILASGKVKRRRVGDVEVEFDVGSASSSGGGSSGSKGWWLQDFYKSTPYGQRYLELMQKNFPAVAVVYT